MARLGFTSSILISETCIVYWIRATSEASLRGPLASEPHLAAMAT